jgi:hypothetical protein
LVERRARNAQQGDLLGGGQLPGLGQAPEGAQSRFGSAGRGQVRGRWPGGLGMEDGAHRVVSRCGSVGPGLRADRQGLEA